MKVEKFLRENYDYYLYGSKVVNAVVMNLSKRNEPKSGEISLYYKIVLANKMTGLYSNAIVWYKKGTDQIETMRVISLTNSDKIREFVTTPENIYI